MLLNPRSSGTSDPADGTNDSRKDWFAVGEYKRHPNEVGGRETTLPEKVTAELAELLAEYNGKPEKTLEDIVDFHHRFESIHPFQDGNGRIGRLVLFKECLQNGIVPFIIENDMKHTITAVCTSGARKKGT